MLERLYPNNQTVARALYIVDLLTAAGLSLEEAQAILALAWIDLQYQAWEDSPIVH